MAFPSVQSYSATSLGSGQTSRLSRLRAFGEVLTEGLRQLTAAGSKSQLLLTDESQWNFLSSDPVLDILKTYPAESWKFRFSDSLLESRWTLRVTGTCVNPKGAKVSLDIYAPPPESAYESGYVEVKVDTVRVYRKAWDSFQLGPGHTARKEVLRSPYWKWVEPLYEANLRALEHARLSDRAQRP